MVLESASAVVGAFVMAWLVGEGIIIYRSVKQQKAPPGPGQLLLSSGVFVLLALLAESKSAKPLAITLAWGFDIAAFMNIANLGTPAGSGAGWPPPTVSDTVTIPGVGSGSTSGGKSLGPGTFTPHTKGN